MSIRLYTGIPGSGKTYRVVYDLVNNKLLDKYFIIHNIDGLKISGEYIKSFHHENYQLSENLENIFSYDYQKNLSESIKQKYDRNILWIIDECDKLGMDKANSTIKGWLSMHRHFGQEIYLITQSRFNLHRDYSNLIEVEIRGKRGFIFTSFLYSWVANGETFATDRLRKDKKIFELYKSFNVKEPDKKRSNFFKIIIGIGILGFGLLGYYIFFQNPKAFNKKNESLKKQEQILMNNQNYNGQENNVKSSSINETPIYTYAGKILNNHLISDQWGNIYKLEVIDDSELWKDDSKKRVLQLLNPTKGIVKYNPSYVKKIRYSQSQTARGVPGSGRATRNGGAEAEVQVRELWIDIR